MRAEANSASARH